MTIEPERRPEISMQRVGMQTYRTAVWRAADDSRRPLLYFNGLGLNLEFIQPLAEALLERTIVAFDAPGIGGSPMPSFPYHFFQIAHAAASILDRLGYAKVDVMGYSWGGAAAQQFAFQVGHRTGRVILCSTSMGVTSIPGNVAALMHVTSTTEGDPRRQGEEIIASCGDDPKQAWPHVRRLTPPSRTGYLYQLMAIATWSSAPFLPFLQKAVLVLSGDRDPVMPLANAEMLAATAPRSTLTVIGGAGHLALVTRLDQVVPVIRSFLDKPAGRAHRHAATATA